MVLLREPGFKLKNIAFVLIIAGALGNGIDRAYHGFVVDFIAVYEVWFYNYFPIFNIADIYLTFGVLLFLFHDYNQVKKSKNLPK